MLKENVQSQYSVYLAEKDDVMYNKFLRGATYDFTAFDEKEVVILAILDKLGYPMNESGTYLFKETISEILDEINAPKEKQYYKENLLEQLKIENSDFYRHLASDYLETGLRLYNLRIKEMLDKIDYEKGDKNLAESLYNKEDHYGEKAYKIATYISSLNLSYFEEKKQKINTKKK